MTFMTAACGIRCAAYAGPVPPDANTGESRHPAGEYASHRTTWRRLRPSR